MDLFDELVQLTAALDAHGVEYALCGGVALAIHGAPRATQDIDLLLLPADLEGIAPIREQLGFTLESLPMTFASSLRMQSFTKVIDGVPLMLDVLLVTGATESVWQGRITVPFETGSLRVVSREGLISLKLAAGRPQDIADIARLEEVSRG